MKRKLLLLVGLAVILMLSGCKQQTDSSSSNEGKLYYLEFGQMLKTDFETVTAPYSSKTEFSFSEIKTIRNSLRNCNLIDFSSSSDVTRSDVHDFFTSHGFTPSETDELFSALDERGNIIGAFNIRNHDDQVAYLYIEKIE